MALITTAKTIADTVVAVIGNKMGIDLKQTIPSGSCSTKKKHKRKINSVQGNKCFPIGRNYEVTDSESPEIVPKKSTLSHSHEH